MKALKLSALLIVAAVAMGTVTGCKKIVSAKKLDGAWSVTGGDLTMTNSTTYQGVTTTSTSTASFDGSTLTTSTTSGGVTTSVESSMTMDYTFDKSTGEYTSTTVTNDPEYSTYYQYYYEKDANGNYNYVGAIYQVMARQSTQETSGLYTITGGAGEDIEKNSQIVFQQDMDETTYEDTYTYFASETSSTEISPAGKYTQEWNSSTGQYDYVLLPTSATGTVSNNGASTYNEVWTITELKGGEMTVSILDQNDYEDSGSDYSYSYKTEGTWTVTQE